MSVVKKLVSRVDGYINTFKGLGDALYDSLAYTSVTQAQNKSELHYENLINANALARRVAKLPAREMLRQGYEIEVADDPDYDERPVMDEVERLRVDVELVWAMTLARAVGGAVIVPVVDDGAEDLREPLNYDKIREIKKLRVLSKKNATLVGAGSSIYRIQYPGESTPHVEMHESRLLIFDGERVTDDTKAANGGWGLSVFVALEEPLARLGTSWQALGNMISDCSQGKFKIKGLHDIIGGTDGDESIRTRLRLLAHGRSVTRAIALDAETEDFDWASRNFAGLPDTIFALMSELSSETGIPITKLFGRSAAGMNATGEGDAKDWYNEVAADRVEKLVPQHKQLIRMIMRATQGPTKGKEPERWSLAYNPLWQSSELEQADIRLKTSQADASDITSQVLTPEEVAISRYGGKKYSTRTVIDVSLHEAPKDPDEDRASDTPEDREQGLPRGQGAKPTGPEAEPDSGGEGEGE
jgi:phage-related protein (TIGR01555 family)